MSFRLLRTILARKRLLSLIVAVAVLFAGFDLHHGERAVASSGSEQAVVTADIGQAGDHSAGKAAVGDHHCHGCVVFMAIEDDAAFAKPPVVAPAAAKIPGLAGASPDLPARPPRQTLQLY